MIICTLYKIALIVVMALCALTCGQWCCLPDYMHGMMDSVATQTTNNVIYNSQIREELWFDYELQRVRADIITHYSIQNTTDSYTLILRYDEQCQYTIRDETCTPSPLLTAMKKPCVPETADYLGPSYYGAGDDKLDVQQFTSKVQNQSNDLEYDVLAMFSVTDPLCIPVTVTQTGSVTQDDVKTELVTSTFYTNFTFNEIFPGDLPSICTESCEEDELDNDLNVGRMEEYGYPLGLDPFKVIYFGI